MKAHYYHSDGITHLETMQRMAMHQLESQGQEATIHLHSKTESCEGRAHQEFELIKPEVSEEVHVEPESRILTWNDEDHDR